MRALVTLILLTLPTAFAAPVPKELKKNDLARLEGEWTEYSSDPNRQISGYRFTFDRDGQSAIIEPNGSRTHNYAFKLMPQTTPPTLTWDTAGGGQKFRAAYRLDGDTFAIVFVTADQPYPKEVKAGLGTYYELRRGK